MLTEITYLYLLVQVLQLTHKHYQQEIQIASAGAVGDTTVTVDDVDLASNVINVGDIIQFSSTAATTDFDDGEFYRVTALTQEQML